MCWREPLRGTVGSGSVTAVGGEAGTCLTRILDHGFSLATSEFLGVDGEYD
jgi:hypothetical protein